MANNVGHAAMASLSDELSDRFGRIVECVRLDVSSFAVTDLVRDKKVIALQMRNDKIPVMATYAGSMDEQDCKLGFRVDRRVWKNLVDS